MPDFDEFGISSDFDADPEHPGAVPPPPAPARITNPEFDEVSPPSESAFEVAQQRELTRSKFALYYIVGFMVIVVISLLISFFLLYQDKMKFDDVTNMLVAISGILSGPLGFIIGYYFKAESED